MRGRPRNSDKLIVFGPAERDRETERQRDRETERQRDREDREDREWESDRERHVFRWISAKLPYQSNIVSRDTCRDFHHVPCLSGCFRSVTWLGGGNSKRSIPSSRTRGMVFTHRDATAGDGSLFLKSFSNMQPDQRTVAQLRVAGCESRKTAQKASGPDSSWVRQRLRLSCLLEVNV